jgi:hypothetical protein
MSHLALYHIVPEGPPWVWPWERHFPRFQDRSKDQLIGSVVARGLIPPPQKALLDKHLLRFHLDIVLQHRSRPLAQRVGAVTYVKRQKVDNPSGAVLCGGPDCIVTIFSPRALSQNPAARGCSGKCLEWEFDWEGIAEFWRMNYQENRDDQRRGSLAARPNGLETPM